MNAAYIVDRDPSGTREIGYYGETLPTNESFTISGQIARATIEDEILVIDESEPDTCLFEQDMPKMDASGTLIFNCYFKFTHLDTETYFSVASSVLGVGFDAQIVTGSLVITTAAAASDLSASIAADTWYQLIVKMTATTIDAYLNGTQMAGAVSTPYSSSDDHIKFGKGTASAVNGTLYIDQLITSFPASHKPGYNKVASSDTTLTCSLARSEYPISNLINRRPNKPVLMTTNTGIQIDIDFAEETDCPIIAILGHNFTRGAIVKIENDDNASFSSPDLVHMVKWNDKSIIIKLDADYTNRYWRISIDDDDNPQPILIGELIMGEYIEFTQNFNWNVRHEKKVNSIRHETEFKQVWDYYLNTIETVSGIDFVDVTDDTIEELFDMFESTKGSHYPLLLIWDGDSDLQSSIYGHLNDSMKRRLKFINVGDIKGLKVVGLPYPKTLDDDVS